MGPAGPGCFTQFWCDVMDLADILDCEANSFNSFKHEELFSLYNSYIASQSEAVFPSSPWPSQRA